MTAEQIVDNLLEADEYGPPAPDNFTNAMGTAGHMRELTKQKAALMSELVPSLGLERQLRKAGVTRQQVLSFIRAQDKYPGKYAMLRQPPRGGLPPDAIVGMRLEDGTEIMFDLAVMPKEP
jgi:hypothetical protein